MSIFDFNKPKKEKKVIEKKEKKEIVKKVDEVDNEKRKEIITNLVLQGDISKMNDIQRVEYYNQLCLSLGLNPLTKPFDIIPFPKQGKVVLYPNKDCAEQLRKKDGVSIYKVEKTMENDIVVIKAYAKNKYGILDEATSSLPLMKELKEWKNNKMVGTGEWKELNPQEKADALMKAETKAKRRVTFSICGLGMPDDFEETERYNNITPENKGENILKEVSEDIKKISDLPEKIEAKKNDIVVVDNVPTIDVKVESGKMTNKKRSIPYKKIKEEIPTEKWNPEQKKEELLAMIRPYQKQLTKEQIEMFITIKGSKDYPKEKYEMDLKYVNLIISKIKEVE
jgi:hypothetical protein